MAAERTIKASVTVAAPPERVWELLCDTSRYAEWVEGTLAVVRTDGPAQLDSTYDEKTRIAGPWKASTHWRVTEFDPPRRMVHEGEGVFSADDLAVVLECTPAAGGTEVTIAYRYKPKFGPIGALIDRGVVGTVTREQQRSAENFAAFAAREVADPAAAV